MSEKPLIDANENQVVSLHAETEFVPNGIASRTLLKTSNARVVLFGFAEGQELTEKARAIKSPAEIEVLRQAGKLAAAAVTLEELARDKVHKLYWAHEGKLLDLAHADAGKEDVVGREAPEEMRELRHRHALDPQGKILVALVLEADVEDQPELRPGQRGHEVREVAGPQRVVVVVGQELHRADGVGGASITRKSLRPAGPSRRAGSRTIARETPGRARIR